jgi:hypothetical protein
VTGSNAECGASYFAVFAFRVRLNIEGCDAEFVT